MVLEDIDIMYLMNQDILLNINGKDIMSKSKSKSNNNKKNTKKKKKTDKMKKVMNISYNVDIFRLDFYCKGQLYLK